MISAGQVDAAGHLVPMPAEFSEAQRAVVIAEAGWRAVEMAILVACDPTRGRHRKSRRVWKTTVPEAGAAAAIFMAHGIAEMIKHQLRDDDLSHHSERQEEARRLLRAHLPWSEADDSEVVAAALLAGPPTGDPAAADHAVIWGALRRLVGDENAARLPGFAVVRDNPFDADTYLVTLSWQLLRTQFNRPYLALTDPELVARFTEETRPDASAAASG
jgi:hypothetical protein